MTEKLASFSAVERYASTLKNSRTAKLPPDYPKPQPPSAWPAENVALFERYLAWLIADGAGHACIQQYYLPMAGHVFGYHLQPNALMDCSVETIEAALARSMAFVEVRRFKPRWLTICRSAIDRFRRFLLEVNGLDEDPAAFKPPDLTCYHKGLPEWLVEQLTRYQHIRQVNWRQSQLKQAIRGFWSKHTRLWLWLFDHYPIQAVSDVKRAHLYAYVDQRLAAGYGAKGVNQDLRAFQATLHFLQEREFKVPQALLKVSGLREADPLPRFLTDEQVRRLQTDLERRVEQAKTPSRWRDALLNRAAFYLLWQGGLRLGEVEDLAVGDLNLSHRQLVIRQGKGRKDRVVYLTEKAVSAVLDYLAVRGEGPTAHLFLYRHKPVSKDFLRGRIKAAGERSGVKVAPHQLRHTYATQLVNAGCRITTLQALMGHRHLNTTLTYARVHNRTVAEDYYTAMAVVEKRLALPSNRPFEETSPHGKEPNQSAFPARQMLALVETLQAEPLSESQQLVVTKLQSSLAALTESLTFNGIPKEFDSVVNERGMKLELTFP